MCPRCTMRAIRNPGSASKLRGTLVFHCPRPGGGMADPVRPVTLLAQAALPTRSGTFNVAVFAVDDMPGEVLALMRGPLHGSVTPLVRLHSECLTGDVLGSLRCDCGQQLSTALGLIGLANKIRAYALQDQGLDTVDANLALGLPVDRREYASAAAILVELGLRQVRLLTNNPAKHAALEKHGIRVVERVPLAVPPNPANRQYLRTKADRMGHLLAFEA